MNFPSNTEWQLSAKGNKWRKLNDKMLIVGGSDAKGYWGRVDETYLKGRFLSLAEAMTAVEEAA